MAGPAKILQQLVIDAMDVKVFRIIMVPKPFYIGPMFLVVWIAQYPAEFKIPSYPTHIFRWTRSFAFETGQLD